MHDSTADYRSQFRYESQREEPHNRALSRAQGVHVRLGGSGAVGDGLPPKPKGMHRTTYRDEGIYVEKGSCDVKEEDTVDRRAVSPACQIMGCQDIRSKGVT